MMEKLKVGVIGVGHLGRHHARVYQEIETTELIGISDTNEKVGHEIQKKLGVPLFSNFRELLPRVAAVSLVTPTPTHYQIGKEILEAGKHLLIEKPITENVDQAKELVDLAASKNLILQVGHIERFNPAIRALDAVLEDPRFIECHRLAPYQPRGTDVGVVLDLMIHDIDIILHLVRSPIQLIQAVGVDVLTPYEDIANVRIEFDNGCVANISTSRVSYKEMRKIRLFQKDCYISLDYKKQDAVMYTRKNGKITHQEVPLEKEEPLALELKSFVDCVLEHKDPLVSGEHGKRALDVGIEIVRQIQHRLKKTSQKA